MNKKTLFDILYVVLIVSLILFMIFIVFWLRSEGGVCLIDPIEYYSNKTNQFCYCNNFLGG